MYVCIFSLFARACLRIFLRSIKSFFVCSSQPNNCACVCIYKAHSTTNSLSLSVSVSVSPGNRHSIGRDIIYYKTVIFPLPVSQSLNHRHATGGCLVCPRSSSATAKKARKTLVLGSQVIPFPFPFCFSFSFSFSFAFFPSLSIYPSSPPNTSFPVCAAPH